MCLANSGLWWWKQANLEAFPPHVPNYLRAAVGPPSVTSRRHFCTVCGFTANYTCVRCGVRFCCIRCQKIHNDTRCLKFVAWLTMRHAVHKFVSLDVNLYFSIVRNEVSCSWEFLFDVFSWFSTYLWVSLKWYLDFGQQRWIVITIYIGKLLPLY